ncbi:hypothetical protein LTR17_010508 [Elasticomyces elasticus]|nr:hypothetical protein LTR17_010508 [Elasticomyces elasticus]
MADNAILSSIYQPLNVNKQEIRVLYLLPAYDLDAPICVDVKTVSLTDKPYYEALSYAWGDASDTTAIFVRKAHTTRPSLSSSVTWYDTTPLIPPDSFQVPITVTLHGALRRLRWTNKARVLWADAICINQANLSEKNEQVSMMGDIYRAANDVSIWLGEDESPHTKRSRDLCLQPHYGMHTIQEDEVADASPATKWGWQAACIREFHNDVNFAGQEHQRLDAKGEKSEMAILAYALYDLLSRPWFTRLWVIQALALAKQAVFLVGSSILPFHYIRAATKESFGDNFAVMDELEWHGFSRPWLEGLRKKTNLLASLERTTEIFIANPSVSKWHSSGPDFFGDPDLGSARRSKPAQVDLMVLGSCGGQNCRDARDRVYALLSFTTLRLHIEVQYTKPVKEVYINTAAAILRDNKALSDVLYHASLHPSLQNDTPSWVPDWRVVERPKRWLHVPNCYHAASIGEAPHHIIDTNRLKVKALFIDKIAMCPRLSADHQDVLWNNDLSKPADKPSSAMQSQFWRDWLEAHSHGLVRWNNDPPRLAGKRIPTTQSQSCRDWLDYYSHPAFWRVALQGLRVDGCRPLTTKDCEVFAGILQQDGNGNFIRQKSALILVEHLVHEIGGNNRPCRTDRGRMGVIGPRVDVGDGVYIIPGCRTPVVLRPVSTQGPKHFRFIELCYIDGVMDGEAVSEAMRAHGTEEASDVFEDVFLV